MGGVRRDDLVAPFLTGADGTRDRMVEKRWEGHVQPKPWQRRVTATFAHLETPELVPVVIDLLRLQTADPHVIIVDTGSSPATCEQLEELRAPEVEIHYVRSHAYRHPSSPVSAACDLAMSLCTSPYLFMTHVDCFLRRRDFLDRLVDDCSADVPVIGYRMSDRTFLGTKDWKWMVSHTATMLHMPTVRRAGAQWAIEASFDAFGMPRSPRPGGWPDTETAFNLGLKRAGIEPKFIGDETNYERHLDDEVDHCLAGDTLVMTREGQQRIEDLAGTSPELLVRSAKRLYRDQRSYGRWVQAPVRSFGEQPVWEVTLSRGSERKTVRATAEHRWLVDGRRPFKERRLREVVTEDLRPGDRMLSAWPRSYASALSPSPFGSARGYVFGDGTRDGRTARVQIWGTQVAEILPLFLGHPTSAVVTENDVPGIDVRGLPRYFKETSPSLDEAPSYLYGWLAGYFAADGRVQRGGSIELVSVDRGSLEVTRRIAETLGISTYAIHERKRHGGYPTDAELVYSLRFVASSLAPSFFLLRAHRDRFEALSHREPRAWYVEAAGPTGSTEPVYCATVDRYECFALDDNLLTGNCRSFPGSKLYSSPYHQKAQQWVDVALDEARERASRWRRGLPDPAPGEIDAPDEARTPAQGFETCQPSVIRELVLRLPVARGGEVRVEQGGGLATLYTDQAGSAYAPNPLRARKEGEVRIWAGRGTYRVTYQDRQGRGAVVTARNA